MKALLREGSTLTDSAAMYKGKVGVTPTLQLYRLDQHLIQTTVQLWEWVLLCTLRLHIHGII